MMPQAFICDYIRTPIGRYAGALSRLRTDDLAALVLQEITNRNPSVDWERLDDVLLGCANQAGEDNRNIARMATLLAGLPQTVPAVTINRLCGSGLDAILNASRMIQSAEANLVIAGGVEGMSRAPMVMPKATVAFSRQAEIYDTTMGWRFVNPALKAQYGVDTMPETAEHVAKRFQISRQAQDEFAFQSQQKTAKAIANQRLTSEIIPVSVPQPKGENVLIAQDEHPRETSLEKLAQLKPLFPKGTVTAGNSSGINDGAAAVLVASEEAIQQYQLEPLARVIAGAVSGVEPAIMGIGPISATQKLCQRLKLQLDDIGIIELNEAFASQSLAVLNGLGIDTDDERVNPNGGAIALGHPLGMSGTRIAGTAIKELRLKNQKLALATMCIGVGQGIAAVFEKV